MIVLLLLSSSFLASSAAAVTSNYWTTEGFLPKNKDPRSCISSSLSDLCHQMKTNANSTQDLANAAKSIQLSEILLSDEAVQEDAFHHLTIAACRIGYNQNPHAKGAPNKVPPIRIPSSIAIPLLTLSQKLHREPAVGYASLVLDNCVQSMDSPFIDYNAWDVQRTVTSSNEEIAHRAEKGFYAAHCAVERAFAPALTIASQLQSSSILEDKNILKSRFRELAYHIRSVIPVIRQMRHFFNAEHFFFDLRPFLKCGNIMENGIIYESNSGEMTEFTITLPSGSERHVRLDVPVEGIRGPTGAMTSALSALDAVLQIESSIKSDSSLETTMNEFREFQPKSHVDYITELPNIKLRDVVLQSEDLELIDVYNDVVTAVAEFRISHIDHVMTYIFKSIPHVPPTVVSGTGNTPIVHYLCRSAIGTLQSRAKPYSKNLPSVSLSSICIAYCLSEYKEAILHAPNYCSDIAQSLVSVNITSFAISADCPAEGSA